MIGSPSARSAARSGMPAKSSASSTLVATSSWASVNPMTSNSPNGAQLSIEKMGRPSRRSASHMSGAGMKPRSAARCGRAFTAFTRMRRAWFGCPSS